MDNVLKPELESILLSAEADLSRSLALSLFCSPLKLLSNCRSGLIEVQEGSPKITSGTAEDITCFLGGYSVFSYLNGLKFPAGADRLLQLPMLFLSI